MSRYGVSASSDSSRRSSSSSRQEGGGGRGLPKQWVMLVSVFEGVRCCAVVCVCVCVGACKPPQFVSLRRIGVRW